MLPSVRGRERWIVAAALASSSVLSGGLAGFVGGVAALPIAPAPPGSALVAVALAIVLTVVLELSPLAPLSVRRQVPQLWGRIFSTRTTALLYGARLGVGPLTILRTWWWWTAFVLGALAGVWWSVLAGAVFGLARVIVMVAVGPRAAGGGAGSAGRVERTVAAGGALALAVAATITLAVATPAATPDPVLAALMPEYRHERGQNEVSIPTAVPADTGLGAALPGDIGEGFEGLADDHDDGLGPLDLDTAVAVEEDPSAERALLETRRFRAGHARAWRAAGRDGGNGLVVYAAVYRFASAEDAAAYLTDGFLTLESRGARVSDLAGPPGARAFSQAASDDDGSRVAHGVAFVRGDRFFLVFESSRTSAATAEHAAAVARTVDAWQRTAASTPTTPATPTT